LSENDDAAARFLSQFSTTWTRRFCEDMLQDWASKCTLFDVGAETNARDW